MPMLLVCYEGDLPSLNMKKSLLSRAVWEDMGSDGRNTYLSSGSMVLMTIDTMHVHAEDIDKAAEDFGIKADGMIVLSRHSSASGKPTLTVHPIGNYKDNQMGGRERTLVRACPHTMTSILRRINELNDDPAYGVSFEVTHHGPYVGIPTMYIEIGSDGSHWGDTHAADVLAESILSRKEEDYLKAIGVGGGHYAPRFSEMVLTHKIDFGHMVPNYQLDGASDEEARRMISDAAKATDTKVVYVHRNSMKGPEERRINSIIDGLGLERISSKDVDGIH